MLLVQLPNGVLGVKRVLGYGKRFIVDYVTWTCPDPKSAGCHLGTLEDFFYSQNKMAPFRDSFIVINTTLVSIHSLSVASTTVGCKFSM